MAVTGATKTGAGTTTAALAAEAGSGDSQRPFRLARVALAIVVPTIAYASLRPFQGWRDLGRGPFAFLLAPSAPVSAFDAILNVAGYVLLSLCLVLSLYPRLRGLRALAIGTVLPALCSVLVEAAQSYLPGRVASVVDVATNSLGALLGAALALRLTPWLADHRGGRLLRQRWLVAGHLAEAGLLLLAAWLVALFAQRTVLFGAGDFRGNLQAVVVAGIPGAVYAATEAFVVAANLLAAGLVLRLLMPDDAPRLRAFFLLVAAALVTRVVAQMAFWHRGALWQWVTPAAVLGMFCAGAGMVVMRGLSRRAAAGVGIVLLLAGVIVVNVMPPDPRLWLLPSPPREHTLIGLALVARYVSKAWPLAAIVFLGIALRSRASRGATRTA